MTRHLAAVKPTAVDAFCSLLAAETALEVHLALRAGIDAVPGRMGSDVTPDVHPDGINACSAPYLTGCPVDVDGHHVPGHGPVRVTAREKRARDRWHRAYRDAMAEPFSQPTHDLGDDAA